MVSVYSLLDLDSDGLQILCAYKFRSKNYAYNNLDLSVPDLVRLDVHLEGLFEGDAILTLNISDANYKIIEIFLKIITCW